MDMNKLMNMVEQFDEMCVEMANENKNMAKAKSNEAMELYNELKEYMKPFFEIKKKVCRDGIWIDRFIDVYGNGNLMGLRVDNDELGLHFGKGNWQGYIRLNQYVKNLNEHCCCLNSNIYCRYKTDSQTIIRFCKGILDNKETFERLFTEGIHEAMEKRARGLNAERKELLKEE